MSILFDKNSLIHRMLVLSEDLDAVFVDIAVERVADLDLKILLEMLVIKHISLPNPYFRGVG